MASITTCCFFAAPELSRVEERYWPHGTKGAIVRTTAAVMMPIRKFRRPSFAGFGRDGGTGGRIPGGFAAAGLGGSGAAAGLGGSGAGAGPVVPGAFDC
ncbi:MAG TPA: hypothetical protein VLY21_00440 [Nitrososphaerales archaeon]|nr:hypothetical protein [Nitrososphaerales archaeon]